MPRERDGGDENYGSSLHAKFAFVRRSIAHNKFYHKFVSHALYSSYSSTSNSPSLLGMRAINQHLENGTESNSFLHELGQCNAHYSHYQ